MEKKVVKSGRDRKWINYQDEKSAGNNIFLHNGEGFCRFMCMNYEQFIELTEMIALLFPKKISDEESDIRQTKTSINLKIF